MSAVRILWHKLDNEGASEIGVAPVITNSPLTLVPAVWGLGVNDCGAGAKAMQWNNILAVVGNVTKGAAWFQWKPAYDITHATTQSLFYFSGGGQEIEFSWFGGGVKKLLCYYWRGNYKCQYRWNYAFSSGTQYSAALFWDGTEGAKNRFKLYVNKGFQVPFAYTIDGAWAGTAAMTFYLCKGGQPTNAVQDNMILWDDTDADINGIDYEDGLVPAGGGRLIDGKMIAPLADANVMIN